MSRKITKQFFKITASLTVLIFSLSVILTSATSSAQNIPNLPPPGMMVSTTSAFTPALIKGLTIHPENPLLFDFIVDGGQQHLQNQALKEESNKLIKYFLAALTIPEEQMWVNLSPHEQDRIIPEALGLTEMGRDFLAQDYILKQITSSLMFPENELGKNFWERIYSQAGVTNIPMFNPPQSGEASPNQEGWAGKVWIVPDKAVVYEHKESAFVVEGHLKVMLREDTTSIPPPGWGRLGGGEIKGSPSLNPSPLAFARGRETQLIEEIILPTIEKEVNEGENFATLRQIYHSMILATWYKKRLRESLLGQVYVDQNKIKGVDVEDKNIKEKIYNQYLEAFKKGVYNFVKDEYDPTTQQVIPRKYFSGGLVMRTPLEIDQNAAMLSTRQKEALPQENDPIHNVRASLYDIGPSGDSAMAAKNSDSAELAKLVDQLLRRAPILKGVSKQSLEEIISSVIDDSKIRQEAWQALLQMGLDFEFVRDDTLDDRVSSLRSEIRQSDESRNWGVYFLQGRIYRRSFSEPPGIIVEYEKDVYPGRLTDLNDPKPGEVSIPPINWRYLDLTKYPPTRIFVSNVYFISAIKKILEERLNIPVEFTDTEQLITNSQSYYHAMPGDAISNLFDFKSIFSTGERFIWRQFIFNHLSEELGKTLDANKLQQSRDLLVQAVRIIVEITDENVDAAMTSGDDGTREAPDPSRPDPAQYRRDLRRATAIIKTREKSFRFNSIPLAELLSYKPGAKNPLIRGFKSYIGSTYGGDKIGGVSRRIEQAQSDGPRLFMFHEMVEAEMVRVVNLRARGLNQKAIKEAAHRKALELEEEAALSLGYLKLAFKYFRSFFGGDKIVYPSKLSLDDLGRLNRMVKEMEEIFGHARFSNVNEDSLRNIIATVTEKIIFHYLFFQEETMSNEQEAILRASATRAAFENKLKPDGEPKSIEELVREDDFRKVLQRTGELRQLGTGASQESPGIYSATFSDGKRRRAILIDRKKVTQSKDDALLAAEQEKVVYKDGSANYGGIDFNSKLLDLQIKRDDNGVPLPMIQQPIKDMKIQGFLPVIIQITPVTNLRLLLGISEEEPTVQKTPT